MGTLVERTSRLVMLVKLPEFKPASVANVLQALTDKLVGIAEPMRMSMTYDQGPLSAKRLFEFFGMQYDKKESLNF